MYCPRCSQERISEETSFCSRCGFLLTRVADLLLTDGEPVAGRSDLLYGTDEDSPRNKGVKRGVRMIMLMFVLAPVLGLISVFLLGMVPWPMGVAIILFGGGGLLRIIYALLFESKYPAIYQLAEAERRRAAALAGAHPTRQLAPEDSSAYIAPSLFGTPDTNDLEPGSVTEGTTRLLEKEQE
jgi:hypothetical protein